MSYLKNQGWYRFNIQSDETEELYGADDDVFRHCLDENEALSYIGSEDIVEDYLDMPNVRVVEIAYLGTELHQTDKGEVIWHE